MAQLIPLPLAVCCSIKSRLVPAHPGSHRQRAVKWVLLLLVVDFSVNLLINNEDPITL